MRFIFLLFSLSILSSFSARAIDVLYDYAQYYSPQEGGVQYVETYLNIPSNSISFKDLGNNQHQASVEVVITFKKEGKIENFDKYVLNSPIIANPKISTISLLYQKRFVLEPGQYFFEINLKDLNNKENHKIIKEKIVIAPTVKSKVEISDILLVESYSETAATTEMVKNGLEIVPYVFPYYPNEFTDLTFYTEIYHTDKNIKDDAYLVTYSICRNNEKLVINNLKSFSKQQPAAVNVLMGKFNLEDLKSGNYNILVEVRDKKNKVLAEKTVFFQRNNKREAVDYFSISELEIGNSFVEKINDADLKRMLTGYIPIADQLEVSHIENVINAYDRDLQRQFILNFWLKRNPTHPDVSFEQYSNVLEYVESHYKSNIGYGCESDRGLVFLKYGAPNQITDGKNEGGSYPYEIWRYNLVEETGQANRMFVFYAREKSSNEFQLIHSDVRGELANERWEMIVFGSYDYDSDNNNLDNNNSNNVYGSKKREF